MLHDPDAVAHPQAGRILGAVERLMRHQARTWDLLEPRLGLNEVQAQVLAAVRGDHRQVSAVAEALGRHVSTASRVVDQLVRSGHLDRVEDPDDRRAVHLSLTDAGREAMHLIEAMHGTFLGRALARLGDEGAGQLADAMERLADAADQVGVVTPEEALGETAAS